MNVGTMQLENTAFEKIHRSPTCIQSIAGDNCSEQLALPVRSMRTIAF